MNVISNCVEVCVAVLDRAEINLVSEETKTRPQTFYYIVLDRDPNTHTHILQAEYITMLLLTFLWQNEVISRLLLLVIPDLCRHILPCVFHVDDYALFPFVSLHVCVPLSLLLSL